MEQTNKTVYPKSTLYPREFLVELSSGYVEVKALTFKELDTLNVKYSKKPNSLKVNVVKKSLLDVEDLNLLSDNDLDIIYNAVLHSSTITSDTYDATIEGINIIKEDMFNTDDFRSCTICQDKGLDTLRNCPMLAEDKQSPDVFYLVNNKKLTECPMDTINNTELISDALQAFTMYKNKLLPIGGGFLDQTEYFYRMAPAVFSILNTPSLEDL